MVATYLGVMCLSGDVADLSDEQWALVDRDIEFYRSVRHIIAKGDSAVRQCGITSYSDLKGYQTVVRDSGDELLVTVHTFGGELPKTISVHTGAGEIVDAVTADGRAYALDGEELRVEVSANFEASAFHIKKK